MTAVGELLRLEHLRFGPAASVFLFAMTFGVGNEWRDVSPHLCREDRHSASLMADAGKLLFSRTIVGPQKRESIRDPYGQRRTTRKEIEGGDQTSGHGSNESWHSHLLLNQSSPRVTPRNLRAHLAKRRI